LLAAVPGYKAREVTEISRQHPKQHKMMPRSGSMNLFVGTCFRLKCDLHSTRPIKLVRHKRTVSMLYPLKCRIGARSRPLYECVHYMTRGRIILMFNWVQHHCDIWGVEA
jgi:hypothetical protein